MCFSAEASFTSAAILGTIGALTMKEAYPKKMGYFAVIPLVFALQQFLEGIVWWTMSLENNYSLLHDISTQGFLLIAGVFWPLWIPCVLYRIESSLFRKKVLSICIAFGTISALAAVISMLLLGNEAQVVTHHLAYPIPLKSRTGDVYSLSQIGYSFILMLYVFATIGASFVSSIQYMWVFGVLALMGFIVAQILYAFAFGSVWCFFAALISMICYIIVKKAPSLTNQ